MCEINERWLERQQANDSLEKRAKMARSFNISEYIKWLEKFTEEHSEFWNDDFEGEENKISTEDKINLNMFPILHFTIMNYVKTNYAYEAFVFSSALGIEKIYVKYNNKIYEIGKVNSSYFCRLHELRENIKYICFEDILNPNYETLARAEMIKKN